MYGFKLLSVAYYLPQTDKCFRLIWFENWLKLICYLFKHHQLNVHSYVLDTSYLILGNWYNINPILSLYHIDFGKQMQYKSYIIAIDTVILLTLQGWYIWYNKWQSYFKWIICFKWFFKKNTYVMANILTLLLFFFCPELALKSQLMSIILSWLKNCVQHSATLGNIADMELNYEPDILQRRQSRPKT